MQFLILTRTENSAGGYVADATSDTELTDQEDTAASSFYTPRLRRRNRRPRRRRNQPHYFGYIGNEEVDYLNTLPEEGRMVEIRSNIWGTKFKIHGVDLSLPPLLGQVSQQISTYLITKNHYDKRHEFKVKNKCIFS